MPPPSRNGLVLNPTRTFCSASAGSWDCLRGPQSGLSDLGCDPTWAPEQPFLCISRHAAWNSIPQVLQGTTRRFDMGTLQMGRQQTGCAWPMGAMNGWGTLVGTWETTPPETGGAVWDGESQTSPTTCGGTEEEGPDPVDATGCLRAGTSPGEACSPLCRALSAAGVQPKQPDLCGRLVLDPDPQRTAELLPLAEACSLLFWSDCGLHSLQICSARPCIIGQGYLDSSLESPTPDPA